jgi:xylan 1,4-beta-xylosidase
MSTFTLAPSWNAIPSPLRHTWAPIGNIDQFRWRSRADVQRHLAMARDELGVRYVRAAAMFSPELAVWDYDLADWRKPGKSKRPNWQLIDLSLEALLELGLKPIYTTCFTPVGLTDDPTNCWPDKNATGLPRDLQQWTDFIATGLRHHLERYGRDELRSWYFELWNEPNLKGTFFGGTREEFFQLWDATHRAFKTVDPELRLGGPSTARAEWIPEFLDWTEKHGTRPDYLIAHVYNNDSESQPLSPFDGPASHKVKDSPHFASGVIRGTRRELERRGFTGEVHWNEWGRSWFPYDPLKETALEAAFIAKTMCEVSQDADAFGFWCLSDIYHQVGFQSSEFQANYGMLSLHGLRKPSWFAHVLLQRLGVVRVPVAGGDELVGALATRDGAEARVLVYAYPENHDAAPSSVTVRIPLPPGIPRAPRLFRVGAAENNIIATWRALGAPAYPTRAQLDQLRAANVLQAAPAGDLRIEDGHAVFAIERPGIALLES